VKLSPTPSSELDFEYESRLQEEQMDRAACLRRWEEDLVWRNRMQNEELSLNQRERQFNVREAHLR
jgi:hypothetical protein